MTYVYHCEKCDENFEIIKSHRDMENTEWCYACGSPGIRQFLPERVFFIGTRVEHAEWNPGLGCVVRDKKHRAEIAKQKGFIEVGNENPENWRKRSQERLDAKLDDGYTEAFEEARAICNSSDKLKEIVREANG